MKRLIAALLTGCILLTGCAGGGTAVTTEGNEIAFNDIKVNASFPESWTVYTDNALYEQIFKSYSDSFKSAEDMKSAFEETGLEYLVYGVSADLGSIISVSVQDMEVDASEDIVFTAEEYARSVHDTAIFSYQSSGYKIQDGSFSEATYGGKNGYLSNMEIISADEDNQFVIGMSEFMFEEGSDMYTVNICYSDAESREEATAFLDSMKSINS